MAHVRADRVMETTTTTGTGTITVAGAVTGFKTLASRLTTSDTFDYVIFAVDGSGVPTGEWETGIGTYTAANQFSRSVSQSSNSDALVNFSAGTKRVAMTLTAADLGLIAVPSTEMRFDPVSTRSSVPDINSGAISHNGLTMTQVGTGNNSSGGISTSYYASRPTLGRATSNTVVNSAAITYTPAYYTIGSSGGGGFKVRIRAGMGVNTANDATRRCFYGMASQTSFSGDPSAFLNCIGIGADSADTNLHLMHNDGSGTCTKVDLGANFPAKPAAVNVYTLELHCEPSATSISYKVTRENTGDVVTGTITTDLPVSSTQMRMWIGVNNGPSVVTQCSVDLFGWISSDG